MRSIFFFKQKTAYEMRISDWSSDVCSSDLLDRHLQTPAQHIENRGQIVHAGITAGGQHAMQALAGSFGGRSQAFKAHRGVDQVTQNDTGRRRLTIEEQRRRSEEHTSELQSLMRISYAVFCLKKKKTKHITTTNETSY